MADKPAPRCAWCRRRLPGYVHLDDMPQHAVRMTCAHCGKAVWVVREEREDGSKVWVGHRHAPLPFAERQTGAM